MPPFRPSDNANRKRNRKKRSRHRRRRSKRSISRSRRGRGRYPSASTESSSSSSSASDSSGSSSSSERGRRRTRDKRAKRARRRSLSRTPVVSQNVILSSVIPEFDPLVDDIAMWINVVEANSRSFGWSDKQITYQALQKLKNTAKTWYDSLLKTETRWTKWRWEEWRSTLLDTFEANRNMFVMLNNLMHTKPAEGQSLYEFYFQQKSRIVRLNLFFSDRDIISIIVGLIGDKNISTAAEAGNFKYCDDLASFLHSKVYSSCERQSEPVLRNTNSPGSKQNASRPLPSTSGGSTSTIPRIKCYICGEQGHKRYECKKKNGDLKCSFCKKPGHLELACRSKPSTSAKVERDSEVKLISTSCNKEKFYKEVSLNNVTCKAFIDMGSDCSLITSAKVHELNLIPFKLNNIVVLTGFNYESRTQVTEAVSVLLKVDNVEFTITFYIITSLSDCNILIGRNFTENTDIMYTRVGDRLVFKPVTREQVFSVVSSMFNGKFAEHADLLERIFSNYPQCVSNDLTTLGETSCVELNIELTTNKPVYQRPYRTSESEKQIIRQMIDELLDAGIVRESNSPYASPVLLVDKPNGQKRLCVDYRSLNKVTVQEKYPMPLVEELIDRLKDCKCFTSLDLKNGYYQIKINEASIPKTAFITSDGHYEFLRMPFGLCNGPSVFQRLMNTVLGKLRFNRVICYMDDLLLATGTLEENIKCLELVLGVLQENGLTINLDKCNFFQNSVTFLGYEINKDGIRPGSKKLEAVKKFPPPTNSHQVRQFLGLINFFRKFIRGCAVLCKPLTKLLKKDAIWEWSSEQSQALEILKKALSKASLTIFDPKLPVIMYTDASRDGIGCILVQVTESGEKPVYFYSRQTSVDEKKYHSFELEFLAITVGLQKFRHYLLGINFKIVTDCNAVRYSINKKEINSRIGRWVLQTQEFTFDVAHRPGTQMQHVDALSRNPVCKSPVINESVMSVTVTESDWLLSVQLQDPNICAIKDILESGNAEANKQIFKNYELLGNKVYRRTEYGRRWLVPKVCVWQIIRLNHDDVGHFAVDKTLERVKNNYWFPRMKKVITKYIKNCLNCIYYKNLHGKKPGVLFPIPKFARPFHTLHIDHLGPFIKTTKNNTYLLVVVDSFTKFVFIAAVRNTKSKLVIAELNKIFKIFGNTKRLICDAGSAFTSKSFVKYCNDKNIRQHVIATAMPRSNGQVERYNATILEALRSMGANTDCNQWDKHIDQIQQGINSTVNKTTSAIPSEVFFGYRLQMDSDKVISDNEQQSVDVTELRKEVDYKIQRCAEKQKENFDAKRKAAYKFKVGDLVVIKIPSQSNDGQSSKLLPVFKGPFEVTQILGHDRYKVADMRGAERTSRRYEGVTCVENMKPWITIGDMVV